MVIKYKPHPNLISRLDLYPFETSPVSKLVAKGDPVFLDQYLEERTKIEGGKKTQTFSRKLSSCSFQLFSPSFS